MVPFYRLLVMSQVEAAMNKLGNFSGILMPHSIEYSSGSKARYIS